MSQTLTIRRKTMTIMEYGQQDPKVILLLHGGGLFWWNYREVAKHGTMGSLAGLSPLQRGL